MGLTLDATNAVAESLLDWETSIAAEQEASMILGGLAPTKLITMGLGAKVGAGLGAAIGLIGAGMISSAGDVFSPAKGRTQISPKEGGLYNLSKNDDVMAGPGIASGGGAPVVNVDTTEMVAEQKRANDLAQKRYEQAEMHSKKAGRDVTGAFAQR
jgi:hypothetical protein